VSLSVEIIVLISLFYPVCAIGACMIIYSSDFIKQYGNDSKTAVYFITAVIWPVLLAGVVMSLLCLTPGAIVQGLRALGRGFAALYAHHAPKRIKIPRAVARRRSGGLGER